MNIYQLQLFCCKGRHGYEFFAGCDMQTRSILGAASLPGSGKKCCSLQHAGKKVHPVGVRGAPLTKTEPHLRWEVGSSQWKCNKPLDDRVPLQRHLSLGRNPMMSTDLSKQPAKIVAHDFCSAKNTQDALTSTARLS